MKESSKINGVVTPEFIKSLDDHRILWRIFNYYRAKKRYLDSRSFYLTRPMVYSGYLLEDMGKTSGETAWIKRKFESLEDIGIKGETVEKMYYSRKKIYKQTKKDLIKVLEENGYL